MDKRFGVGERVKYARDWPHYGDDNAFCIPKGSTATVVMVPPGASECYLVRLDVPLPGWQPEMSCSGSDIEPE